jgi:hypothetical protein
MGRTLAINASYEKDQLALVHIDLDHPEKCGRLLL